VCLQRLLLVAQLVVLLCMQSHKVCSVQACRRLSISLAVWACSGTRHVCVCLCGGGCYRLCAQRAVTVCSTQQLSLHAGWSCGCVQVCQMCMR
jgi:hypothetical protein